MSAKKFTDMNLNEIEKLTKIEWKRIWKTSSNLRLGPKILDIKAEKAYSEYTKFNEMQKLMKQMQINQKLEEMKQTNKLDKIVEPVLNL